MSRIDMRPSIVMMLAGSAFGAILGAPDLRAAEIHKCAGPQRSIAYQTSPCDAGQREIALLTLPSSGPRAETPAVYAPSTTRVGPPDTPRGQWLPFARRPIAAGMTDDEVLNSSNGGVPAHIARTREGRTWREVWTYVRNGDVRELEFVNGRLSSVGEAGNLTSDPRKTGDLVRLAARRE